MNIDIKNIERLNAALAAYEKKNGAITKESLESANWTCSACGNCTWNCDGSCSRSCSGSYSGH